MSETVTEPGEDAPETPQEPGTDEELPDTGNPDAEPPEEPV